jgi:hypothetical protein
MKKSHGSHRGSFLLFFAVLCSACVQRAQADETIIVPELTGTANLFVVGNGSPWFPGDTSVTGLQGYLDSTPIVFSFGGVSSDELFDQQCTVYPNHEVCDYRWSGTFSGGSVSLTAFLGEVRYDSTGTIIPGGSFSGDATCSTDFPCSLSQHVTFDFTSTWTSPLIPGHFWRSDGTLVVDSSYPPMSFGTLNMTTVTPEPDSWILVASGIFVVAVFLRRRQNMQQCWRTLSHSC